MVHKIKKEKGKMIEWGFDLTQVSSDEAFLKLLDKYGFKEVHSKKPTDKFELAKGETMDWTYGEHFAGRFKTFSNTFVNPDGIRITVEHMGGKEDDKGFLGYIGIKAPKKALPILKEFLKGFRGSEAITGTDWTGRGGIARYIKQENPHENPYITVW